MATTSNHFPIDINIWTEQTLSSLSTLAISAATTTASPALPRGTSVTLDIPLDLDHPPKPHDAPDSNDTSDAAAAQRAAYVRRREPLRRDSLKRREALLKGKEGSRRRQKWENDRLLGNPWAQPPSSQDWEIPIPRPRRVPYSLASQYDDPAARRARAETEKTKQARAQAAEEHDPHARVPRELRAKLKRAKGAKGLLQDLEEQVRQFVVEWEGERRELEEEGLGDVDLGSSEEDEEIVFVGRNGRMREAGAGGGKGGGEEKGRRERMVFDSLVDDHGASFGRWLVHSIASYYDLHTWSVTTGKPARREAYVGIKDHNSRPSRANDVPVTQLPRPLYVLV